MSIGKICSPLLQQRYALNTLKANFWSKVNTKKRFRLIKKLKPVPTIYPASTKTSFTSKVSLPRKSPKKRVFHEDHYNEFKRNNNIIGLESITESGCSCGYLFAKYEDHVVFHKIVLNELHGSEVTACMQVDDKFHRKLFLRGFPVPLPQWSRYGDNCKLTSKGMLENFPSYLESLTENFNFWWT